MSSFTLAWHFLIFGVLPYVVIAVLILGSLAGPTRNINKKIE